ncbi:MAG: hydroxymethylbilane synthase [bacterium]|nr:hydroxymethylbilane synthase [bacterium]
MIIGTRGSALARTQTEWVRKLLESKLDAPVDVRIISTQGDRVTDRPLRELEGSGYFTKELEEALLDGRIDVAVHSFKDMPSQCPTGLVLAAVSAREDAADILVMLPDAISLDEKSLFLKPGAMVGTSAVRREAQLKSLRPDVETRDLRGNVPTRLSKLRERQYDAILLASAGVRRLGLSLSEFRVPRLEPAQFVPAPGQGALAIQMRDDDRFLEHVRAAIHCDGHGRPRELSGRCNRFWVAVAACRLVLRMSQR